MSGKPMTQEEAEQFRKFSRLVEADQAIEGLEKPPEFDLLLEAVIAGRMTVEEAIETAITTPQAELIAELTDGLVF
jgi:hypothetical protein